MDVTFCICRLFIIYSMASIFTKTVLGQVQNIQFKRSIGNNNKNDIACGILENDNVAVAVKLRQGDKDRVCDRLEHDWLLNKTYTSGYDYIEKIKVMEIFNPPKSVGQSPDIFKWTFPTSFDVGGELKIIITMPPDDWTKLTLTIFDTVKEILQISSSVTEIAMHHLSIRKNLDDVIANSYKPGQSWGREQRSSPCPVDNGGTHVITLQTHQTVIRTIIDSKLLFDNAHAIAPKKAAILVVSLEGGSPPFFVQNITMKRYT